ncbi:hypothetical protein D3C81_1516140 [compost metagenome]
MFCKLDCGIDRFSSTIVERYVLHRVGRNVEQGLGEFIFNNRRKVMVACIIQFGRLHQSLLDFRIPVTQVVDSSIQMHVDNSTAIQIPETIAFALADDNIHASVFPRLHLFGVPNFFGSRINLLFRWSHCSTLSCLFIRISYS